MAYKEAKKFDAALTFFQRANGIYYIVEGEGCPGVLRAREEMTSIYSLIKDLQQASGKGQ